MMRKFGQEIIKATAGKKVHGTGAIPGGINKNLSIAERDALLKDMDQMIEWSLKAVRSPRTTRSRTSRRVADFGTFDSNHLSIVRDDGAMDLYHGNLRAVDPEGNTIIDGVPIRRSTTSTRSPRRCALVLHEVPVPQDEIGPETAGTAWDRWRDVNTCDFIDTPRGRSGAPGVHRLDAKERPCNVTMAYHWTRMIELLHSGGEDPRAAARQDLQGDDLVAPAGERREEYVAIIEAPRGTLTHHYRVNEDDQVTMANLIVSTTCNNEGDEPHGAQDRRRRHLSGRAGDHRGPAQQHRGRHPRLRSVSLLCDPRARADAARGDALIDRMATRGRS